VVVVYTVVAGPSVDATATAEGESDANADGTAVVVTQADASASGEAEATAVATVFTDIDLTTEATAEGGPDAIADATVIYDVTIIAEGSSDAEVGGSTPTDRALGTIDLIGTSSLTPGVVASTPFAIDLNGAAQTDFSLDVPLTVDPLTKGAGYRVVIVDQQGRPLAEMVDVQLGPIRWSIVDKGTFTFTVPVDDPRVAEVSVPDSEVQVWRDGNMRWWGVVIKARSGDSLVEFQCETLEWYFDRRLMGPIPRLGHFGSSHFEFGYGGWNFSHIPGTQPANRPLASLTDEDAVAGQNSMILSLSGGQETRTRSCDEWFTTPHGATLSPAGNSGVDNITSETFGVTPRITIRVYHDNQSDWKEANQITQARADAITERIHQTKPGAIVYAVGMGEKNPVETNTTVAGRVANRRIVWSFRDSDLKKGHGQYAWQQHEVKVPQSAKKPLKVTFRAWVYIDTFEGPAMNGWGLVIERQSKVKPHKDPKLAAKGYKRVLARKVVPINKATPRNRWVRMEASVNVPSDGNTYVIEGRLFPPSGTAYFDEADLYTDDSLDYVNEEQANIVRDLLDHAQETASGKSDLNIGRRIRKTGVKRTRHYSFSERTVIGDHLNEFTKLADGLDWEIVCTPSTRTFTTYHPRKDRKTGYTLELGRNLLSASVDVDGTQTSTSVVVMANDVEAYAREERSVVDTSLTDGVSMEIAYMATPASPVASLYAQARRGIERYRKPTTVPSVTSNPAYCTELLKRVKTGDVVDVDVRDGWFETITKHRILDMTLDPTTEQIQYTLMPEDAPIKVKSNWGKEWRYFSQPQGAITGTRGVPVASNPEYAARDFNDAAWSVGQAGIGWWDDGTPSQAPTIDPNTTIPVGHEVWMRRTVPVTEEMYVSVRSDRWTFVYVNGNLVRNRPMRGRNFGLGFAAVPIRVPHDFLHPSGQQLVAVHTQARLHSDGAARALYADCKVRGIYDRDHVGGS
jgi:hypothetical protein